MNVLLINGSPHAKGCTYTALSVVAGQLEKHGISTHMIHVGHKPIHGCIACGKCAETRRCVFNDDPVNETIELLLKADGLVVGSPVYYGGPNGILCSFLDRIFFTRNELFAFKPAAAVVSCRRGGRRGFPETDFHRKAGNPFSAGGTVIPAKEPYNPMKPTPEGQTLHGDHASVFYQIPVHARKYPLVFLHGAGQSMRTWQTTPDGREGFQNVFLRRGFGVYLVDQPRRGDAGRATVASTIEAKPDEQYWFGQFRIGVWPNVFRGSQFARGDKAMDQFLRQMTPNTAPFDYGVISDAMAAVLEQSGPAILVTHSQGGGVGWLTALKSHNVKAIVSYEPGSGFLFPEGEVPDPIPNASAFGPFKAKGVPLSQFMALTKMPIVIYYGDNIPSEPVTEPHEDYWRAAMSMALKWAETVNRHGGDVTVVHLPDRGLHGNTHFPFSDRNSLQVADLLSRWLKAKKLD